MYLIIFCLNVILLLLVWQLVFNSKLWNKHLAIILILFISPVLFGLSVLVFISNFVSLEIMKINRRYINIYSSLNLLLLIPQWYKLAWSLLNKIPQKNWTDTKKLFFAVLFAVFMVFAMVVFFAVYYLWIYNIGGHTQGLLAAHINYQLVDLDFSTSLYFSFVTYFTLGYGDLIPQGFWMRMFVFIECLAAVLNTGIIAIYVFNFLFSKNANPVLLYNKKYKENLAYAKPWRWRKP